MADEKDEKIGIIYGKHADFLAWMMTQDGPWKDFQAKAGPPKTEFFWPSKPDLPSLIAARSSSDGFLVPYDAAMAREYLLLEYADAVKKVAMEMVDAGSDVPHSKAWYVNLADRAARHEQLWNTQWEEARVSNKELESKLARAEAAAQQMEGEANNWRERYYAFKADVAKLVGYDE